MSDDKKIPDNAAMILITDPAKWVFTKVIDLADLNNHCGGHIIAVVSGVMGSDNTEWVNGRYERVQKHRTVAIMANAVDQHLRDLGADRNRAQQEAATARNDLAAAVKKAEDATKKCEALERGLAAAEAARQTDAKRATEAGERLRKLEGDLAKVREVFGSKAYDDAIGKKG